MVSLTACGGESGYAEVPVQQQPAVATRAQQDRYGVAGSVLVLLELTPDSFLHEVGPSGAFRYRPYEVLADCHGRVQLQEHREFRKVLRPQSQTSAREADCNEPMRPGFSDEPEEGDSIYLSVIEADDDDWGVLIVVAR